MSPSKTQLDLNAGHSLNRLDRVARWHFSPSLRQLMPSSVLHAARELRTRVLSFYIVRRLPRHKEFSQSADDAQASASLSIVVPVHDAPAITKRCLTSLEKYAPKAEIILIDDASKLEETRKLLEDFSTRNRWRLIRHPEALGHSAASSVGVSVATRPYLCLLNSDTVVTPWCWRPIVQAFEQDSTIGVAGPSTSSGGYQALPLAYSVRHHLTDNQICVYAHHLITGRSDTSPIDAPSISGFAFCIRRDLWDRLGGFDPSLPDYGNEIEFCRRAAAAGYRLVWVRSSYIHHFGQASYGGTIGVPSIMTRIHSAERYIDQKYRGGGS